jgi:nicotinamide riboside kinase
MKIKISVGIEVLVFTGPESSGKTTCAKKISKNHHLPLVQEYAREYLTTHGSVYTFKDIQKIAAKQIKNETASNKNSKLIICDTDIITLEIWALEKFGASLKISDVLINKKHYFLCYPDIPWESDPLRENPEDRLRLFDLYSQFLTDMKVPFTVLSEKYRNELYFEF